LSSLIVINLSVCQSAACHGQLQWWTHVRRPRY